MFSSTFSLEKLQSKFRKNLSNQTSTKIILLSTKIVKPFVNAATSGCKQRVRTGKRVKNACQIGDHLERSISYNYQIQN